MALTDNLSFYLECNETSGTRVDSHAARNFTPSGTLNSTTGIIGNGASWPSLSGVILARNSETALQPGPSFSYQVWFNSVAANIDSYAQLVGKDDTSTERQWAVYLKGLTNQWALLVRDNTGLFDFQDGVGSWTDSTNYHVIITFNSADGIMRLYLNTSLHASTGALTNPIKTNGTHPFEIGARTLGGNARFSGMMDLIGYWQRVLTGTEITTLYNSGAGLSYAVLAGGSTTPITVNPPADSLAGGELI